MKIKLISRPERLKFLGILLTSLIIILSSACKQKDPQQLITIKVGIPKQPASALIHIALSEGIFKQQGLRVIPHYYPSGKRALVEGLLSDEVQYITTADVPFVWKSFTVSDLRVLASIYRADNVNRIVARKDAGIATVEDLSAKKIATQKSSAVHYFLHSVMVENQIPYKFTHVLFYKAEALAEKLATAEIDAFSMREPYISQAIELLGNDNAIVFAEPGLYIQNELLVSRQQTLDDDPAIAEALLRALVASEKFAQQHPEEAIKITAQTLNIDIDTVRKQWHTFQLLVSLEHTLLFSLEREADWMLTEHLVTQQSPPDFSKSLYRKALQTVKPDSVLLLR